MTALHNCPRCNAPTQGQRTDICGICAMEDRRSRARKESDPEGDRVCNECYCRKRECRCQADNRLAYEQELRGYY